jgi:hypothetical protein
MIVKRKLYSVMDEEGNLGYYLYNESTGEEKLFSIVEEEERMYARGVGRRAVKAATKMAQSKGQGMANKAAKNIESRVRGAKMLNIPKYKSDLGKTILNPEFKSDRVIRSGRSVENNALDRVTNANLGKGKATVHDRINLRSDVIKGDHVDLQNTHAFDTKGFKPIRNLNRGYAGAFNQEIIGASKSFKNNKTLQNLGVVKKPGVLDKIKSVFRK